MFFLEPYSERPFDGCTALKRDGVTVAIFIDREVADLFMRHVEEQLPVPKVDNWERLYQPDAKVRCIKDNPPMRGFGRALKVGDVVELKALSGLTYCEGRYEVPVSSECAFYALEGYFEVIL